MKQFKSEEYKSANKKYKRIDPRTNKPFEFGDWILKDGSKKKWFVRRFINKVNEKGIWKDTYTIAFSPEEKRIIKSKFDRYLLTKEIYQKHGIEPKFRINPETGKKFEKNDKSFLGYIFVQHNKEFVDDEGYYYAEFKTYPEKIQKFIGKKFSKIKFRHQKKFKSIFDLTPLYLLNLFPINLVCPISKKKMIIGEGRSSYNASLDRINNTEGYVIGNVMWVSHGINLLKSDKNLEEMEKIIEAYKKHKKN